MLGSACRAKGPRLYEGQGQGCKAWYQAHMYTSAHKPLRNSLPGWPWKLGPCAAARAGVDRGSQDAFPFQPGPEHIQWPQNARIGVCHIPNNFTGPHTLAKSFAPSRHDHRPFYVPADLFHKSLHQLSMKLTRNTIEL